MKKREFVLPVLGLCFVSYIISVLVLCATPPVSRDVLIHHLAIPKLWLNHGGIFEIPWAMYSYSPMNLDLLYLVCLFFKSDIAPKFVHLCFGLGTGALIYQYLKKSVSTNWAVFGALFFLTVPVIIKLQTTAYVDLGLTFFIFASMMSLLKWSKSGYENTRYFLVSAVCMGLAIGTKHNALIAWCFVNMCLVFIVARDNKEKQLTSIFWGGLFFVIVLGVVGPWFFRNYLWTGNPVYPLFSKDYSGGVAFGLFDKRKIEYGENLWQILLIPFRMFFFGQDNHPRFFDGVLNPVLLLAAPFAFMKKGQSRDVTIFWGFCVFFILIAFFSALPRIRYLACVIPFFVILSTLGLESLYMRAKQGQGRAVKSLGVLAVCVAVFCLAFNARYLYGYFKQVDPLPYVLGTEDRQAFLTRHIAEYQAITYINSHLPTDARVMLIFIGKRGYYLDREYFHRPVGGALALNKMVKAVQKGGLAADTLKSFGATHIFVRLDLFFGYLRRCFDESEIEIFFQNFNQGCIPLFVENGYAVYAVNASNTR